MSNKEQEYTSRARDIVKIYTDIIKKAKSSNIVKKEREILSGPKSSVLFANLTSGELSSGDSMIGDSMILKILQDFRKLDYEIYGHLIVQADCEHNANMINKFLRKEFPIFGVEVVGEKVFAFAFADNCPVTLTKVKEVANCLDKFLRFC